MKLHMIGILHCAIFELNLNGLQKVPYSNLNCIERKWQRTGYDTNRLPEAIDQADVFSQ
jgi:hypothetical protein